MVAGGGGSGGVAGSCIPCAPGPVLIMRERYVLYRDMQLAVTHIITCMHDTTPKAETGCAASLNPDPPGNEPCPTDIVCAPMPGLNPWRRECDM